MLTLYVGVDTAITTGIAVYSPEGHLALTTAIKAEPIRQFGYILNVAFDEGCRNVVVMEKLHNFRNAKTTRSLLERYGYLKYSLMSAGYLVEEVSPLEARKYLGTTGKMATHDFLAQFFEGSAISDHETDALAVALYQAHLDGYEFDQERFRIAERILE